MKRKLILLLIVSLTLTSLTGCWNRRELNELGFVIAVGIDKTEDNQYIFTVQMVDPGEVASRKGSGGRAPVTTYRSKGRTLYEAAARLTTFTPRAPYWAHNQIYVYSEEAARDGIANILDVHERDHEVRSNFYFLIAKNAQASDILEILTPLEDIPANKLFTSLETTARTWGSTVEVRRDDLIAAITSDGRDPVLAGLQIVGDPKKAKTRANLETIEDVSRLQFNDVAVFRKDKLVGWLNEEQSKGYNYTQGKIKKTFIGVPCNGGKLVVELIRTDSRLKGSVKNGTPVVQMKMFAEANIAEIECNIELVNSASITELEKKVNDKIRAQIMSAVEICQQEYQSDIFGFGEVIHRGDPVAWRTLKKDWHKHFAKTQVVVEIDTKIRRIGTITIPPQNVMMKE